MKDKFVFASEFLKQLPLEKIADAKRSAVSGQKLEIIEIPFGKLLDGKMTIKIEFDQRTDAQKNAEELDARFKLKEEKWADQNWKKGKLPSLLH